MFAFFLSCALAGEASWSDVLSDTAPRTFFGELGVHTSISRTLYVFTDLAVGAPLYRAPDGHISFGVGAGAGLGYLFVPAEQRDLFVPRDVHGSLWLGFPGPRRLSHHTFGLRAGGGLTQDYNTYFIDHREAATFHAGVFYDGYVDTSHVDVHLRADLGGDELMSVSASGTVVATWKVTPAVGLQAGFRGGFTLTQSVLLGARFRPVEGLEIATGVVVPFYSIQTWAPRAPPWAPSLQIRVYSRPPEQGPSADPDR